MELTKEEKLVRKELEKLYPQLQINAQKTCGAAFEKHGHDVLMVAIEFFLNKPIEVQLKAIEENKMENFITFIMATQLKSGSSHYYHHYRKHHEKQREFFPNYTYRDLEPTFDKPFQEEEKLVNVCVENKIKELPPYEKMLIEELVKKENTYTSVSKQFKIPYGHLKRDLTTVLKRINRECQHLL
jgi:hypothetical protein